MFVLFFFELKARSASGEHWWLIVGDDDDDKESELKHRRDIISHHHLSLIYFQIMPWIFFFSVLFGRWNCGGNEEDWCRDFVLDHPDRIWPVEDLEFARLDQGFLFLTPLIVRMKSQHIAASPLILENLADSIVLMFFVQTIYWCKTCDRRIRFGA